MTGTRKPPAWIVAILLLTAGCPGEVNPPPPAGCPPPATSWRTEIAWQEGVDLDGIWCASPSEVFAVDGFSWSAEAAPGGATILDVRAVSPAMILASCTGGVLLRRE